MTSRQQRLATAGSDAMERSHCLEPLHLDSGMMVQVWLSDDIARLTSIPLLQKAAKSPRRTHNHLLNLAHLQSSCRLEPLLASVLTAAHPKGYVFASHPCGGEGESVCVLFLSCGSQSKTTTLQKQVCVCCSLVRERRRGGEEDDTRTRRRHGAAITLV